MVENFLTKEELRYFDTKIRTAKWKTWNSWKPWCWNVENIDDYMTNDILDRIASLFDEKYTWTGSHIIQRIQVGHGLAEHDDNPTDKENSVGIAIYLNDDFDGGEIYYPNLGLIHKPVKGSLICHPGNLEYTHGVKTVLNKDRYILSSYGKKVIY